jgi:hypothetical protein
MWPTRTYGHLSSIHVWPKFWNLIFLNKFKNERTILWNHERFYQVNQDVVIMLLIFLEKYPKLPSMSPWMCRTIENLVALLQTFLCIQAKRDTSCKVWDLCVKQPFLGEVLNNFPTYFLSPYYYLIFLFTLYY